MSLRVAQAVTWLEQRANMPVSSSNHAMAWHCLRLGGIDDFLQDCGSLFRRQIR